MGIDVIPIQGLWKLLRWLPGFFFRLYFTPKKLADLIYIDIRPRHDSATVNLGQSASFTLYLQAINLSPFSVELDRASFQFWCGGTILKASILNKQQIAPGEIANLYVHESIPDGYANQIAKQIDGNQIALDGNIEFNCKICSFAKNIGSLNGINARFLNLTFRVNT